MTMAKPPAAANIYRPPGYPLLGHIPPFLKDKLQFLESCIAAEAPVVELSLGRPTYLLNNPADIQHVLEVNHSAYTKTLRLTSRRGKRLSGEGLLTSSGTAHLRQRRLLQPVFRQGTIAGFADAMVAGCHQMLERWRDGAQLDIASEMMGLAHRNIGKILFNADFWGQDHRLGEAILVRREYIQYLFSALLPFAEHVPNSINRRYRRAIEHIDDAIATGIRQRQTNPTSYGDLLSLLVQARYRDGSGMDASLIRDEALTISVTGYETIGEALTWSWYLIARHPDVAARLRAEVDRVLQGQPPSLGHLPQLVYTRQILDEAMRIYPPTWIYIRMAQQTDTLPSGVTLPAGSKLYLCPYVVQRNPHLFPEPHRFDPTRFEKTASQHRPRFAYFPFGGGPRVCIGQALAEMEGVLMLAQIAQVFRLSLCSERPAVPEPGITLRPRGGLPMRLQQR